MGSLRGFVLPLSHRINSVNAPSVSYTFRVSTDVHMFYCEHDNTMNFVDHEDESRLEIANISPRDMYTCVGNALAANDNLLNHIEGKPWQVSRAKEMITHLQAFVDKHSKAD